MGIDIKVNVYSIDDQFMACYGNRTFSYNLKRVGAGFFSKFPTNTKEVVALIAHEFGHEYSDDHLSSEYHEALCKLAAELYMLDRDGHEFVDGVEGTM